MNFTWNWGSIMLSGQITVMDVQWAPKKATKATVSGIVHAFARKANSGHTAVMAVLVVFWHSLQKYYLRYMTIDFDGDKCMLLALCQDQSYGFNVIPLNKEYCANHVKERMGTALCNTVTKK